MIGRATYDALSLGIFGAGVVTFVALLFVVAPYGRHVRSGWGPTVPDRVGWIVMESPSLFWFSFLFFSGKHHGEPAPLALWAMWALHYANRTIVYPFRTKTTGKRMPLVIVAIAIAFNVTNATANASFISDLGEYPSGWMLRAPFVCGALLFATGMLVNMDADRRLFALRARGESAYKVPHGGLYERVSCPNYLGEIVEWIGWAIASFSLGGAAFAFYTIANLAPRAASNHAWYRKKFPEYPSSRKALVPFVWCLATCLASCRAAESTRVTSAPSREPAADASSPASSSAVAATTSTAPPAPNGPRDERIRARFGERCRFERACGALWGIDCDAAVDGPYYYVKADSLEVVSRCGGYCMGGRCTNCPPREWSCPTY